jgi:protein-arginine deiminase
MTKAQIKRIQLQRRRQLSFGLLALLALSMTLLIGLHDPFGRHSIAPAATIPARYHTDLVILSDTNRDGVIDDEDVEGHRQWSWATGAFMLANVDDDDQDQQVDAADQRVNGEQDAKDLTLVHILLSRSLAQGNPTLRLSTDNKGSRNTNVFQQIGQDWQYLDLRDAAPLNLDPKHPQAITLGIEAKTFANGQWDGILKLRVEAIAPSDQAAESESTAEPIMDAVALRVSPWLMLPNTAKATDVYIGRGFYPNETMIAQLEETLPDLGVTLHQVDSQSWEEMWLQDTMEIGYQQAPGRPPMHVVLQANRGIDPFPRTLLAPNVGFITIGEPREVPLEDELVDWMGNLEVTPPLPGYPLGRIYYGKNVETGVAFHPEMVAFLEAQAVQAPVWVDTSWLLVKHVDEIFSFVNDSEGRPHLLVNNTQEGTRLVQKLDSTYQASYDYLGVPGIPVEEALAYSPENREVQQEHLEPVLAKARQDFGLESKQIIPLPVMMTSPYEAQTIWSNPVNSIYVNGMVFVGDPVAPQVNGKDLIQAEIRKKLEPLDVEVKFIDDSTYQAHGGNVHCATNAMRLPVVDRVWEHLPDFALNPSAASSRTGSASPA